MQRGGNVSNGNGVDVAGRLGRVEKDLYYGNGKPGITTRIQQNEDCLEQHGERMDAHDRRIDGVDTKFWAIILLLITLLAGVVVDITEKATHRAGMIVSAPIVAENHADVE